MKVFKSYFLYLCLLLFSQHVSGITIVRFEPAIIEIDYVKHIVLDTINPTTDYSNSIMTLRIGKNTSSFFSPKKVWRDSLVHYNFNLEYQLHLKEMAKGNYQSGGREKESIYKNYPTGQLTVTNNFSMSHWIYSEPWEKPEWILRDSTATVMNLECQLAECHYRGRVWFVLFCTALPFSDGPWKLSGLPGLILKAWDSKEHYVFEATDIRTADLQDVGIYHYLRSDLLKTTHDRYYSEWYKALHEDIGYKMARSGVFNADPKSIQAPRQLPHRNYDFEETDYAHE